MLAYCRKTIVDGVMTDKDGWRTRLRKRHPQVGQPPVQKPMATRIQGRIVGGRVGVGLRLSKWCQGQVLEGSAGGYEKGMLYVQPHPHSPSLQRRSPEGHAMSSCILFHSCNASYSA